MRRTIKLKTKFTAAFPLTFLGVFILLKSFALADTGPCKPLADKEVLICGEGNGAAIVIHDTNSPSEKLALAWHVTDSPPTEEPQDGKIELLVIIPEDGKILAKGNTEFWDTGEMHANRRHEAAYWSPDSQWLIAEYSSRFSSDILELYALDGTDRATGPLDIMKIVDPAVRAKQKAHSKNPDDFSFSIAAKNEGEKSLTIDKNGNARIEVMLWSPKNGPFYYYTVRAKAARLNGKLALKILSVTYRGMEKTLD